MYVASVEVTFDAAHRLLGYPGKCASAHGHTFRGQVVVATEELDRLGLTLDFRDLKAGLKAWVDRHWDHAFLANDQDAQMVAALGSVPECKLYLFRGVNPSAEAIARELFDEARRQFGAVVQRVRVWETPTQYAEYVPDHETAGG
jgi:6-pyruvoyltetrahydropterin/6-carboxytetrahydropterin synthase